MVGRCSSLLLSRRAVAVLFALLIAVRLAAIACAVTPSSDADWYYRHAALLAQGRGYIDAHGQPTAYWPVGWPWLLSLAFRVWGVSIWSVAALNLIAATASGWLLYDCARRIWGSELAGRIALLVFALYPNGALYVPLALTEVAYTALVLGMTWLVIARRGWLSAGLVLGLATLVKAQSLVLIPVFAGLALLREPRIVARIPRALGHAALMGAAAALVIAPWTWRNHRVLGEWVMVSTNGGITLLTGNNDSARGGFTPDDALVRGLDAQHIAGEVAYDRAARTLGQRWIATHPLRFAELVPLKLWHLWGPDGEGLWAYETGSPLWHAAPRAFWLLRAGNQAVYWALLALFAVAPWWIMRRRRADGRRVIDWWLLAYAMAAYPSAIAVLFSGQSRFHYPAMPFVILIAAGLIASLFHGAGHSAKAR